MFASAQTWNLSYEHSPSVKRILGQCLQSMTKNQKLETDTRIPQTPPSHPTTIRVLEVL